MPSLTGFDDPAKSTDSRLPLIVTANLMMIGSGVLPSPSM